MSGSAAIDNLINSSEHHKLEWIPCSEITEIKSTPTDGIYCAAHYNYKKIKLTLVFLGSSEECTPTLVSEFSRIYSLPTHKYNSGISQFRRYATWLENRNKSIKGFMKYDDNYYMVADKLFYHCYSQYGFCTACGILRCSPVWCTCGHKQLSDGWTSNNKQLDEFIKKSQLQTISAHHAYLEWIPYDCIGNHGSARGYLYGLNDFVELIPLEITDETHDIYYAKVNY